MAARTKSKTQAPPEAVLPAPEAPAPPDKPVRSRPKAKAAKAPAPAQEPTPAPKAPAKRKAPAPRKKAPAAPEAEAPPEAGAAIAPDAVEARLSEHTREIVRQAARQMAASGMNQEGLAARLGKHKSVVSRILSGSSNLTLRTIAELETALDARILSVAEAAETPAPPPERPADPQSVALPRYIKAQLEAEAAAQGASPDTLAAVYLAQHLAGLTLARALAQPAPERAAPAPRAAAPEKLLHRLATTPSRRRPARTASAQFRNTLQNGTVQEHLLPLGTISFA